MYFVWLISGCYWLFPKVGFGELGAVDYLGLSSFICVTHRLLSVLSWNLYWSHVHLQHWEPYFLQQTPCARCRSAAFWILNTLSHFHLLNTRSWNAGHKPRWDTKAVQPGVWRRSCQRCNGGRSFQCHQGSRYQSAQGWGCAKSDIWLPLSLCNQHCPRNLSKNCFFLPYICISAISLYTLNSLPQICQIGLVTAYVLKALYFGRWVIVVTDRFSLCSSATLLSFKSLPHILFRHSTDREVALMALMAYLSYMLAEVRLPNFIS